MTIRIGISSVCTAFEDVAVGSKVIGKGDFCLTLQKILEKDESFKGSGFIEMPSQNSGVVRSGVALISNLSDGDIHARFYRGVATAFADPSKAEPCDNISVLVYDLASYADDPQVSPSEVEDLGEEGVTHVVVAVHAGAGDMGSIRLVRNIAGGNSKYIPSGDIEEEIKLLHKIIDSAIKAEAFEGKWLVVADRIED